MARYGRVFKERAVTRLLPPESALMDTVAQELGVSVSTLERWRAEALSQTDGKRKRIWTAVARLEAVIATAA
ncbi:MAG: transposase, partial [Pseudomonadota bacterium]